MGQHFQDYGKKYQFFKGFSLFQSFEDNEAFTSSGQVAKLAPDAERQVFQWHRYGTVDFQSEKLIDVPVGSAVFGGCVEVGMIPHDKNHFRIFANLRNAGNEQSNGYRLATMVKHHGMGEKG
ncbi:hypothetical protein TNCV_4244291 [Trichonephila clavipes]|nr:hypothetical protein TNCV_4244291 [Trichonephila clavipes]